MGRFVFVKERKVRGGPVWREWVGHEVVGDPAKPSFDAWGCQGQNVFVCFVWSSRFGWFCCFYVVAKLALSDGG